MRSVRALFWREIDSNGPGDPPRKRPRRRVGSPPRRPTKGFGGPPHPEERRYFDRAAPWVALTTMSLGMALPYIGSFPNLEGREGRSLILALETQGLDRSLGALTGLASVLLMYGGLQRLVSRLVAFLAAMLLAVTPAMMQAVLQANGDGVSLLASTLVLLVASRALDRDQPERLWPSLSLLGALSASFAVGHVSPFLAVLGIAVLIGRDLDRPRIMRLLRPMIAGPVLALLIGVAVWRGDLAWVTAVSWEELSWGSGSLITLLAILPLLPLLAPAWLQISRRPFQPIERVALAMVIAPLLAAALAPWQAWSIGLAVVPPACVIAALILTDESITRSGPDAVFRHVASRVALALWSFIAGGLSILLLLMTAPFNEESDPAIVMAAIGAICLVALGVMWGWQGRGDRLALASVLVSCLLCTGAMAAIDRLGMLVR
jgi:hypothetical protein